MTSAAEKRRRKKLARQLKAERPKPEIRAPRAGTPGPVPHPSKPTPEQIGRGIWARPTGPGRREKPWVNRAPDMIGRLHAERKISDSQEQAARTYQDVRAAYLAELGTRGYGSCLDDSPTGHDESDGDPEAIAAYRRIERAIGGSYCAVLADETAKTADQRPHILGLLRAALSAVAERC